jgi:hypothetical protein
MSPEEPAPADEAAGPQAEPGEPKPPEADPSQAQAPGPATPATPAGPVVKRTPQFRQELLKKLPRLAYTSWTVQDNFRVDEEWDAVVNLKADAILGPLETVAPERLT